MSGSSSDTEDEESQWESWENEESDGAPVKSLFDDAKFRTAEAAINYDAETHRFDLRQFCALVLFTFLRL
jgi:hypothetical protein